MRQGITSDGGCTANYIKLRINAKNKDVSNVQDATIANTPGNKFIIPLDFEMLDNVIPYYQAGLGNRNHFQRLREVINASGQTPTIRSQTYPWNTRSLPSQILQEIFQVNTKTWLCSMTEFSDTNKFQ